MAPASARDCGRVNGPSLSSAMWRTPPGASDRAAALRSPLTCSIGLRAGLMSWTCRRRCTGPRCWLRDTAGGSGEVRDSAEAEVVVSGREEPLENPGTSGPSAVTTGTTGTTSRHHWCLHTLRSRCTRSPVLCPGLQPSPPLCLCYPASPRPALHWTIPVPVSHCPVPLLLLLPTPPPARSRQETRYSCRTRSSSSSGSAVSRSARRKVSRARRARSRRVSSRLQELRVRTEL